MDSDSIQQRILERVRARGLGKTICPSEVARELGGENWRGLMGQVREVGYELVRSGKIQITQGGQAVDPLGVKGPIRFRVTTKGLEEGDGKGAAEDPVFR